MTTNTILTEAGAIVRRTAETALKQALIDHRRALQVVYARLRADVSIPDDPELDAAIQQAADAWLDACAWRNFLAGRPAPAWGQDRRRERG